MGIMRAGGRDPLAEIAVVHFRRRDREVTSVGAGAIAESFIGEEEKRLVLAVIDLGNPDRAAGGEAEIVLLVDGIGDAAAGGLLKKLLASKSLLRMNS